MCATTKEDFLLICGSAENFIYSKLLPQKTIKFCNLEVGIGPAAAGFAIMRWINFMEIFSAGLSYPLNKVGMTKYKSSVAAELESCTILQYFTLSCWAGALL